MRSGLEKTASSSEALRAIPMEVTSDRGGWKSGAQEEGPEYNSSTGLSKGRREE